MVLVRLQKMNFISCNTGGKHECERLDEDENLTVHQPQINQTTEISEIQPEHNHLVPEISNSVRCDVLDGGNSAAHRLTDWSPLETKYRRNEKSKEREKSKKTEAADSWQAADIRHAIGETVWERQVMKFTWPHCSGAYEDELRPRSPDAPLKCKLSCSNLCYCTHICTEKSSMRFSHYTHTHTISGRVQLGTLQHFITHKPQ